MPRRKTASPNMPPISPLRTENGEYANIIVISTVIMQSRTPFFLVNSPDEDFMVFPQDIAITKPRIKITAPRISMSIFHRVRVKKLSKNTAIPMMLSHIPFFLVSSFVFTLFFMLFFMILISKEAF